MFGRALSLGVAFMLASFSAAAPVDNVAELQQSFDFAYQYGFPLYAFGRAVRTIKEPKTNFVNISRTISSPARKEVVRPNTDTLYSIIFYDLSSNDLEITVPTFDDRYWVFALYDMYGNDFANIGSLTNTTSGKYLIHYTGDEYGLTDGRGHYKQVLNSPVPYGFGSIRILSKNNATDVPVLHKLQDGFSVTEVPRSGPSVAPAMDLTIFNQTYYTPGPNVTLVDAVMRLTAKFAPYNTPLVEASRQPVNTTLTAAGCVGGQFVMPSGLNQTLTLAAANQTAAEIKTSTTFFTNFGNGWRSPAPYWQGNYDPFYAGRYYVTTWAYLVLTPDQAIYPSYVDNGSEFLTVGPNQAYLLTFSGKPETGPTGFWSLTLYGADQYLIENPLNRGALGDRSNITYADGASLSSRETGEFQILIQPGDVSPPANWTANWLPGPAGGGAFTLNYRIYEPNPSMTNGSYVWPKVELISTIVA